MSEKVIEHHYHDPTQGQVHKALYQYLADQGITGQALQEIIDKKIRQLVEERLRAWMNGKHFDELVVAKVAQIVSNEKKCFENNSYGWHNHIRDLVKAELQRLVLADYNVTVVKKV